VNKIKIKKCWNELIRQAHQIHTYHQKHQDSQSHYHPDQLPFPFPYPYPPTSPPAPPAPAPAPAPHHHHTDPGWFADSDSLAYMHRNAYS
jgi:hypothetical protein